MDDLLVADDSPGRPNEPLDAESPSSSASPAPAIGLLDQVHVQRHAHRPAQRAHDRWAGGTTPPRIYAELASGRSIGPACTCSSATSDDGHTASLFPGHNWSRHLVVCFSRSSPYVAAPISAG
jgi:hypothetical protein